MTPGTLFVVATPIGNLEDLGARALRTLAGADVLACEDTRTSSVLLARHGIRARTIALHEHNERRVAPGLIGQLQSGLTVALISDAGTPGISDPGAYLVSLAHAAGIRVTPVPGPNAAVAAVSAAGFEAAGWHFAGFLPAAPGARRKALGTLESAATIVFYEAPHRIRACLEDLCAQYGQAREVFLARELTKVFEETARMPLGEALAWIDADPHRSQGEYVVVVGPGPARLPDETGALRVLDILLESMPLREAARTAARITGVARNRLYALAMARPGGRERPHDER